MMIALFVTIILLYQAPLGDTSLHDAYYGDGFIKIHRVLRPGNLFLHTVFNNLDLLNKSSENCHAHLQKYKAALVEDNQTWVKAYVDSSEGIGPSWLSGSTVNLGDYDECVAQRTDYFSSNYCWLKVELAGERPHRISWVPNDTPIIFSVCLPESCGANEIEVLSRSLAERHNFTVSAQCQSTRPYFSILDIFSLFIFSCIGLITVSTVLPKEWIPIKKKGILSIWASFNIKKNLGTLVQAKSNSDVLSSLHGIRFLSQCIIIWYHMIIVCLIGQYPVKNKFYFNELFRSWTGTIETELVLTVDTFFMMSGLLLTYNCLKKKSEFHLLKYYVHRYLRLTPPLAACVIIIATFANKFCTGPLCQVIVDKERETCGKYWWTNLLYINNFYPGLLKSCMPHTWYLSADWQLFMFLSPFVVIVINKWPQHIDKLVGGIFLSSIISAFVVSLVYQIPIDTVLFNSTSVADAYYNKMYAIPHSRAGPWAIGMFLGILLHNNKKKPTNLPTWAVILCWFGSVLILCGSVEITLPFSNGNVRPGSFLNALVIACQRNAFALAVSWIIFATTTNIAGPIGSFLSWPVFEPLGKLSYSTYLIHKLLVSLYASETRTPIYYSTPTQLPPVLGIIVLSYAAGFLLYLTFEAPTFHLEKLLFQKISGNQSNGSATTQPTRVVTIDQSQKVTSFSTSDLQLIEK